MTGLDACAEFIKSVGFPVFVAVFVLVRVELTLKELTKGINALAVAIKGRP